VSADALARAMSGWANQIAGRYGFPVYLVGSALTEAEPRDVDVRVVLTDAAFFARFGIKPMRTESEAWKPEQSEGTRRLYAEQGKLSRSAALTLHLNIDFQVQSESIVLVRAYHERPRRRLDTIDLEDLPPLNLNEPGAIARAGFGE